MAYYLGLLKGALGLGAEPQEINSRNGFKQYFNEETPYNKADLRKYTSDFNAEVQSEKDRKIRLAIGEKNSRRKRLKYKGNIQETIDETYHRKLNEVLHPSSDFPLKTRVFVRSFGFGKETLFMYSVFTTPTDVNITARLGQKEIPLPQGCLRNFCTRYILNDMYINNQTYICEISQYFRSGSATPFDVGVLHIFSSTANQVSFAPLLEVTKVLLLKESVAESFTIKGPEAVAAQLTAIPINPLLDILLHFRHLHALILFTNSIKTAFSTSSTIQKQKGIFTFFIDSLLARKSTENGLSMNEYVSVLDGTSYTNMIESFFTSDYRAINSDYQNIQISIADFYFLYEYLESYDDISNRSYYIPPKRLEMSLYFYNYFKTNDVFQSINKQFKTSESLNFEQLNSFFTLLQENFPENTIQSCLKFYFGEKDLHQQLKVFFEKWNDDMLAKYYYRRAALLEPYYISNLFSQGKKSFFKYLSLPLTIEETDFFTDLTSPSVLNKKVYFVCDTNTIELCLLDLQTNNLTDLQGRQIQSSSTPVEVKPYTLLGNVFEGIYGNEYHSSFISTKLASTPNVFHYMLNKKFLESHQLLIDFQPFLQNDNTGSSVFLPLSKVERGAYYIPLLNMEFSLSMDLSKLIIVPEVINEKIGLNIQTNILIKDNKILTIVGLLGPIYLQKNDTEQLLVSTTSIKQSYPLSFELSNFLVLLPESLPSAHYFAQNYRKLSSWSSFFKGLSHANIPYTFISLSDTITPLGFLEYFVNRFNGSSHLYDLLKTKGKRCTFTIDLYGSSITRENESSNTNSKLFFYSLLISYTPESKFTIYITDDKNILEIMTDENEYLTNRHIFKNFMYPQFVFAVLRDYDNLNIRSFLDFPEIQTYKELAESNGTLFLQNSLVSAAYAEYLYSLFRKVSIKLPNNVISTYTIDSKPAKVKLYLLDEFKSTLEKIPFDELIGNKDSNFKRDYFEITLDPSHVLQLALGNLMNAPTELVYNHYKYIAFEWMFIAQAYLNILLKIQTRNYASLSTTLDRLYDPTYTTFYKRIYTEIEKRGNGSIIFNEIASSLGKNIEGRNSNVKRATQAYTLNEAVNSYFNFQQAEENAVYEGFAKHAFSQAERDAYLRKLKTDFNNNFEQMIAQIMKDMRDFKAHMTEEKKLKQSLLDKLKGYIIASKKYITRNHPEFKTYENLYTKLQIEDTPTLNAEVLAALKMIAAKQEYKYDFKKMLSDLNTIESSIITPLKEKELAEIRLRMKPLLEDFFRTKFLIRNEVEPKKAAINEEVEKVITELLQKKESLVRGSEADKWIEDHQKNIADEKKKKQAKLDQFFRKYYEMKVDTNEYLSWAQGYDKTTRKAVANKLFGQYSSDLAAAAQSNLESFKQSNPTLKQVEAKVQTLEADNVYIKRLYEHFLTIAIIDRDRKIFEEGSDRKDLKLGIESVNESHLQSADSTTRSHAYTPYSREYQKSHSTYRIPETPPQYEFSFFEKQQAERFAILEAKAKEEARVSQLVKDVLLARNNPGEAMQVIRGRLQGNAKGSRRPIVRETSIERVLNELKKYIPLTAPHTNRWGDKIRDKSESEIGQAIVAYEKQERNAAEAKKRQEEAAAEAYKKQQEAAQKAKEEANAAAAKLEADLEWTYNNRVENAKEQIIKDCFASGKYLLVNRQGDFNWIIKDRLIYNKQQYHDTLKRYYGPIIRVQKIPEVIINDVMPPPCNNPGTERYQQRLRFWEVAKERYVFNAQPRDIFSEEPARPTGHFGPARKQAEDDYEMKFYNKCGPLIQQRQRGYGGKRKTKRAVKSKQKKRRQTRRKV